MAINFLRMKEPASKRQARQEAAMRLQAIRDEYAQFCKSHFVTVEQALLDFEELIRHPMVQCVDFATIEGCRFLLIGTKHITIIDGDGVRFNIGEFILMFHRSRHTDVEKLSPTLLVENVTPTNAITGGVRMRVWIQPDGENGVSYYPHPHVSGNPGVFCMSTGRNELNLAIVGGDLLEAFLIALSALQSAGPGNAYHDLDEWPQA